MRWIGRSYGTGGGGGGKQVGSAESGCEEFSGGSGVEETKGAEERAKDEESTREESVIRERRKNSIIEL